MSFPVVRGMRSMELGSRGPMRARMNSLALSGAKVACFGHLAEYADEGEPFENVGELLALVDDAGEWAGTVEVIARQLVRAGDVTWAMVEAEGEGQSSVADWRADISAFWASENLALHDDTELVWLRFQLVDPTPRFTRATAGDLELPEGYRWAYSGKVRDLFHTPSDDLLFVASDRISAYDWVLPTSIPGKGEVLTQLSLWWFEQMASLVGNHVLTEAPPDSVARRAMVCRKLEMLPVECVARGYLTGSGLSDYQATGQVCGNSLPPGLVDGSRLPGPIFTPATKAALGAHDENVDFAAVARTVGAADAAVLRRLTLQIYSRAEEIARARGIIVADTKFEFGRAATRGGVAGADAALDRANVGIRLGDEVLTPDSSRFWPAEQWQPGRPQPSFDKQFVRDWLVSPAAGWDRTGTQPPPPLPQAVVERTNELYVQAYEKLTGRRWA